MDTVKHRKNVSLKRILRLALACVTVIAVRSDLSAESAGSGPGRDVVPAGSGVQGEIPNEKIDPDEFLRQTRAAMIVRQLRRVTVPRFRKLITEPGTVLLDARSAEKFKQLHIAGAKNLNFADFTESSLRALIPTKATRVVIYCNNNFKNSEAAFPTKALPAALNLSTFTSLYTYGYRNVYELGPVIDPEDGSLAFEGTDSKTR